MIVASVMLAEPIASRECIRLIAFLAEMLHPPRAGADC